MTINESLNILTLYFLKNTTLKFSDIEKLVPKDKKCDKESCIASLIGALNSPEMLEILQPVTSIPNDLTSLIYVLRESLYLKRQKVEISGAMAVQISQVANSFVDNESIFANPLQINENDIQTLLNIIGYLAENETQNEPPQQASK